MILFGMSKVRHYRQQAAQCRELVANQPLSKRVDRWRAMAENYDLLADSLEKGQGADLERLLQRLATPPEPSPI